MTLSEHGFDHTPDWVSHARFAPIVRARYTALLGHLDMESDIGFGSSSFRIRFFFVPNVSSVIGGVKKIFLTSWRSIDLTHAPSTTRILHTR